MSFPGLGISGISEAEVIADVTGSNTQLGNALSGNTPSYFPSPSLDSSGISPLPSIPGINQQPVAGTSSNSSGGLLGDLFGGSLNPNSILSGAAQTIQGSGGNQPGAWSWTDIPRIATTAVGFIILIAGIFSLTKGNPLAIVEHASGPAALGSTEK